MISKLIEVPIREVWKNEARNFTTWLGNHLEYLDEQLGIKLSLEEIEKSVGTFSADILAKDIEGNLVIIENQLNITDHDHLGKLLTYLSNLNAKAAIWISPNPRTEHETAINYLNQISPENTNFYLIKIRAYKIDSSSPAPLFTIVAGPGEGLKDIGKIQKDLSIKDKKRYDFFSHLLDYSNSKTKLFINVSPVGYQNWVMTGAGKAGLSWVYSIGVNKANCHLFFGLRDAQKNKERFNKLFKHKSDIEKILGNKLEWDFKEGRQQHYIRSFSNLGGLKDESKWEVIRSDMVTRMINLEKAIRKYLRTID
ncbi:MAG: DUF4268 domain-containing protein [Ignavibacteria bacterium]|jgi:hypothetical protein